jgi:uncharacterized protein (TIGR03437 family)
MPPPISRICPSPFTFLRGHFLINDNYVGVTPTFAGLSSAGLYQINLTVPAGLGTRDFSLVATVGGVQTREETLGC